MNNYYYLEKEKSKNNSLVQTEKSKNKQFIFTKEINKHKDNADYGVKEILCFATIFVLINVVYVAVSSAFMLDNIEKNKLLFMLYVFLITFVVTFCSMKRSKLV